MKVAEQPCIGIATYVYCAGHGEYLPFPVAKDDSVYLWADAADRDADDDVRPDWLPDEVAALGWNGDPDAPEGCFIRLVCSEETLRGAAGALYRDLISDDLGGDDNAFDYWPSGARLLWQITADAGIDDLDMRAALKAHVLEWGEGGADEILSKAELEDADDVPPGPLYATNGTAGCVQSRRALYDAIHEIERAYPDGIPERLLPMMRTLEAILMQKGCEDNNVGPRDGYLTSVMDLVIFG